MDQLIQELLRQRALQQSAPAPASAPRRNLQGNRYSRQQEGPSYPLYNYGYPEYDYTTPPQVLRRPQHPINYKNTRGLRAEPSLVYFTNPKRNADYPYYYVPEQAQESNDDDDDDDDEEGEEQNGYDYSPYPFLGNYSPKPTNAPVLKKPTAYDFFNDEPEIGQKRSRAGDQQSFIIDRFGNLIPYNNKNDTTKESKKPGEIDANELIKALLGGQFDDADVDADADEEDTIEKEPSLNKIKLPVENKSETIERPSITKPLTREDLAEIISGLANAERVQEDSELKQDEITPSSETIVENIPTSSETIEKDTKSIPKPKKTPSLNIHKPKKIIDEANLVKEPLQVSAPQLKKSKPFSPPINVYEFESNYIVVISLPGVNKEFVDIDFHPTTNELVVKGEVSNKYLGDDDLVDNSKIIKVSEQRFGSFERVVKLPQFPGVKDADIKAKFKDGLLEVKLPKLKEEDIKKTAKKITLEEVPDEELERESAENYI